MIRPTAELLSVPGTCEDEQDYARAAAAVLSRTAEVAGCEVLLGPGPSAEEALPIHHGEELLGRIVAPGPLLPQARAILEELAPVVGAGLVYVRAERELRRKGEAERALGAILARANGAESLVDLVAGVTAELRGLTWLAPNLGVRVVLAGARVVRSLGCACPVTGATPPHGAGPDRDGAPDHECEHGFCGRTCCRVPIRGAGGRLEGTIQLCIPSEQADPEVVRFLEAVAAILANSLRARGTGEHRVESRRLETLGRLAGGVAHDFNNMLSVILSTAQVLRQELEPGDPRGADLDEIAEAGLRAARLTKQLLRYGRSGGEEADTVDPNAVIAGIERLLRRALREDIALVLDLGPEPWPVRIAEGQLEQVVMNLAVNARDAMPRGGALSIATRNVVGEAGADLPGPGRWVELQVRDTGTGIPHELRSRIFEPFFTTKAGGGGTGLGLATIREIVEEAGGRIGVASADDAGTTFTVWLPAAAGDAPLASPAGDAAPLRTGAGETILVVEDDGPTRAAARRVLVAAGYRVLEAPDGEEALELLRETRIDLGLIDVVLPRMSGPQLVESLPEPGRPAILLMTGYRSEGEAAAGTLLVKPFSASRLLDEIARLLGKTPPAA